MTVTVISDKEPMRKGADLGAEDRWRTDVQLLDSIFCFLPQERLSHIGPEEFIQAFVQKDPLDNDKVASAVLAASICLHVSSGTGRRPSFPPDGCLARARPGDCCSKGRRIRPADNFLKSSLIS